MKQVKSHYLKKTNTANRLRDFRDIDIVCNYVQQYPIESLKYVEKVIRCHKDSLMNLDCYFDSLRKIILRLPADLRESLGSYLLSICRQTDLSDEGKMIIKMFVRDLSQLIGGSGVFATIS